MKVELILPRAGKGKLAVDWNFYISPFTLNLLAALTPPDVELRLTDENFTTADPSWKPDLVGISVMTSQANRALELSQQYKGVGATVAWGGIHPTSVNQLTNNSIDAFFVGEADTTWPKALDDFRQGRLKRVYQQNNPTDMDSLPSPRRDFLRPDVKILAESLMTSRGCPYDCDFCSARQYGTKIRWRNMEGLKQDLDSMKSQYGFIADDNFLVNPDYSAKAAPLIGSYGKAWFAEVDPRATLKPRNAETLKQAGVVVALLGFETVNPKNLERSKKYLPPNYWPEIVQKLHEQGIAVHGHFILGFDNDDPSIFDLTRKVVSQSKMDFATYAVLTPFPGTRTYEYLRERIIVTDYGKYDGQNAVFTPLRMTAEQLEAGQKELNGENGHLFSAWLKTFRTHTR